MHIRQVGNPVVSHDDIILSLNQSRDNKKIISGGYDSDLYFWDSQTGSFIDKIKGDYDKIFHITTSPDGKFAITANYNGQIILWDLTWKKQLKKTRNHADFVTSISEISSENNFFTAGWDGKILKWSYPDLEVVQECGSSSEHVTALTLAGDTQKIYAGDNSGFVTSFLISDCSTVLKKERAHWSKITSMIYLKTRKSVVTSSEDKLIRFIDPESLKIKKQLKGSEDFVNSISANSSETILASGGSDHTIILWDLEKMKKSYSIAAHNGVIKSVLFVSDDKLFSAGNDNVVKVWKITVSKK